MFSSFPNWRLFTVSLSPSCRLQGTCLHSHSFWGNLSWQEMPLQLLFRVGAFWFTDCFCVNHPRLPHSHQIHRQIGLFLMGTSHCAHPSDKETETQRGSDLLRRFSSGGAGDQSRFEMAEQRVCFLPHHLCGGPEPAQPTWLLHMPARSLASAGNG